MPHAVSWCSSTHMHSRQQIVFMPLQLDHSVKSLSFLLFTFMHRPMMLVNHTLRQSS